MGKYKYQLVKSFRISSAHHISGAGKCDRIHGHNYVIRFCISGEQLDDKEMLIDYRKVKHALEKRYDHHLLNDLPEFSPEQGGVYPTTERVAEVFMRTIEKLCIQQNNQPVVSWVEVAETDEAYVRVERIETEV